MGGGLQSRYPEQASGTAGLHRSLGIHFGIAVGVGSMVGVGILRTPGIVAGHVGSEGAALVVWTAGAVYVLLCVNYMAELACAIPRSGGAYAFAQRTLGPYGGTLVGWSDFANSVYAIALLAVALAEYIGELLPEWRVATGGLAAALIGIFLVINTVGVETSSRTQQLTSLVKLVAIWAFITGCLVLADPDPGEAARDTASLPFSMLGAVLAFQLTLGAFNGWAAPAYFSGETKRSPRDVARALFFGALLVSMTYVSVNFALFHILPFEELSESKLPAANALERVSLSLGGAAGVAMTLVTVLAVLSLPSTLQAVVLQTSRTLHAMSADGLFLRWSSRVNRRGSPVNATLASGAVAIVLSTTTTFESLFATFTVFAVLNNAILLCGVIRLRIREPDLPRPFRIIGYPWSVIPIFVVDLAIFAAFALTHPRQSAAGAGVAVALYLISRRQPPVTTTGAGVVTER